MARPKKKKFPFLLLVLLLFAIVFFSLLKEINGGKNSGEIIPVTIEQGSSTVRIADTLKDAGLIHNTALFRVYSKFYDGDGNYQYGLFPLEKGMSYQELIGALTQTVSFKESIAVTFPEGYNAFQMAEVLEQSGLCSKEDYLAAADSLQYDFDFLKDVSDDSLKLVALEGFLFPDTYSFFTDATPEDIVSKQLANFADKVLNDKNLKALNNSRFSFEEWVILSSIIQKESASSEEMYNVSSVFNNRMEKGSGYPMLQSCTTNNFIWDYVEPYYHNNVPEDVRNAYDTYNKVGLPVGSICNAGVNAFDACLHPNDTPYYFFVTDVEYTHYYAITYDEHLDNIERAKAVNKTYGIEGMIS